jgi:ribosomal protein S12 methylthiotransferase accessory factor
VIRSDQPICDVVHAYVDALPSGDWFFFDMSPLDVTGIPAWKAAFFPHDPALAGCDMQQGTGYGADPDQAMIAAAAECHEEVRARLGFAAMEQVEGSFAEIASARGTSAVADPLELCLPAGSAVDHHTPLRWVRAHRWFTGEPVFVPVDVAALTADRLPSGYRPFTTLITNGLGAGPSRQWAAAHGLFECLQRDGNGLRFRAMDAGDLLTVDEAQAPEVSAVVDRIADAGIDLLPKFGGDEFGIANLYVVGADRDPSRLPVPIAMTGAGEAADLDRVSALRKAVLEYAHARARKAFVFGPLEWVSTVMPPGYWERAHACCRHAARRTEPRQIDAFRHWLSLDGGALRDLIADPVLQVRSERRMDSLPTSGIRTVPEKGDEAARRLVAAGLDPLVLDFTEPGSAMHAVRVIVPKLEVETMSYHRIGERNAEKLIVADSPLIRWGRPAHPTLRPVRLPPHAYDRLGGLPLLDTAAVDATVGALYPLYREPGAHEMAMHLQSPGLSA